MPHEEEDSLVHALRAPFEDGGSLPNQLRKLAHLIESGTMTGRVVQSVAFTMNRYPGVSITLEVKPAAAMGRPKP